MRVARDRFEADVRFASLADIAATLPNVRFTRESGHLLRNCRHVSDPSIRIAFSAHGPHIRFALR
jgi:hypothetical protein